MNFVTMVVLYDYFVYSFNIKTKRMRTLFLKKSKYFNGLTMLFQYIEYKLDLNLYLSEAKKTFSWVCKS